MELSKNLCNLKMHMYYLLAVKGIDNNARNGIQSKITRSNGDKIEIVLFTWVLIRHAYTKCNLIFCACSYGQGMVVLKDSASPNWLISLQFSHLHLGYDWVREERCEILR